MFRSIRASEIKEATFTPQGTSGMIACAYLYSRAQTQLYSHTYIYIYICIFIYLQPPPPPYLPFCVCFRLKRVTRVSYACMQPGTYLFLVVYAFGYKFSSSRLQRILHHVCASKPLPPTQLRLLRHGFASICHLRARKCSIYCRQSNSRCT